jgi:hypothetical protein
VGLKLNGRRGMIDVVDVGRALTVTRGRSFLSSSLDLDVKQGVTSPSLPSPNPAYSNLRVPVLALPYRSQSE